MQVEAVVVTVGQMVAGGLELRQLTLKESVQEGPMTETLFLNNDHLPEPTNESELKLYLSTSGVILDKIRHL